MRHLLVNREHSYVTKFFSIFLNFVALSGESNYMEVLWLIKGCSLPYFIAPQSLNSSQWIEYTRKEDPSIRQERRMPSPVYESILQVWNINTNTNRNPSRWRLNNSPTILSENHNEKRRLFRGGWQKGVASSFPMIMKGNMNEINVNGESNECEQWIKWMWIK